MLINMFLCHPFPMALLKVFGLRQGLLQWVYDIYPCDLSVFLRNQELPAAWVRRSPNMEPSSKFEPSVACLWDCGAGGGGHSGEPIVPKSGRACLYRSSVIKESNEQLWLASACIYKQRSSNEIICVNRSCSCTRIRKRHKKVNQRSLRAKWRQSPLGGVWWTCAMDNDDDDDTFLKCIKIRLQCEKH